MEQHHQLGQWGYDPSQANVQSAQRTSAWSSVPATHGVKRPICDSDDDLFSEESSKDNCTSPGSGAPESYQMMSRKKRRGVIEKKRRDRINSSLSELKRLVPTAYEKQGSAKLEKAEILQMTVDHLKMLHAKGLDSVTYDPHKFAMDYHIIGFRECAAEVARYLGTIEGMDIQDPLRLRIMSHLQCFVTQRELTAKQTGQMSVGASSVPPPPPPPPIPSASHHTSGSWYPTAPTHVPTSHHDVTHAHNQQQYGATSPINALHNAPLHAGHHFTSHHLPLHENVLLTDTNLSRVPSTTNQSMYHNLVPLTSSTVSHINYSPQYHNPVYPPTTSTTESSSAQMKPYRPWGAELAY